MATHINTDNQDASLASSADLAADLGHLGVAPDELQQTLKLAGLLQTSLELETVLNYFLEAAAERFRFDGAAFTYPPLEAELQFGSRRAHTCAYRLKLAGEYLGELVFSRRDRFAESELQTIENLLSQLIYPLRNAIWYQRALRSAQIDPLTGINNRTAMDNMLAREVDLAHRNQTPLSLIVADIDFFKAINDQYGHATGDEVLRQFSQTISENLRSSDIVFRYGGEEFVILLTGTNREDAALVAERIRGAVEQVTFDCERGRLKLTASFGAASLTPGDSPEDLFRKADAALYQAKEAGRNCVASHQPELRIQEANG